MNQPKQHRETKNRKSENRGSIVNQLQQNRTGKLKQQIEKRRPGQEPTKSQRRKQRLKQNKIISLRPGLRLINQIGRALKENEEIKITKPHSLLKQ